MVGLLRWIMARLQGWNISIMLSRFHHCVVSWTSIGLYSMAQSCYKKRPFWAHQWGMHLPSMNLHNIHHIVICIYNIYHLSLFGREPHMNLLRSLQRHHMVICIIVYTTYLFLVESRT